MTRTVQLSLGSSPLTGKQGIDQATRFKDQLRSLRKKPTGVTLLTVVSVEAPHMSVVAMYDADDPCAVEWVRQATAVSAELWQKMNERRKVVVR
ncbi:MAG: hypothetical protein JWO38_2341 [Gemmataceae bacterium]|nr:hypothetical protein [Gemmataceae bacterium]